MQIQTPKDLFLVYSFDEDLKIKIIQFFNADKLIVKDISALCLKAKISRQESRLLHTNRYLITKKINRNQKKLNLIYKIENEKVFFIDMNI